MPQPDNQRRGPDRSEGPSLRAPTVRWTPGRLPACLLAFELALCSLALPHAAAGQEQSIFEATLGPARLARVPDAFLMGDLGPPPPRPAGLGPKETITTPQALFVTVESTVPRGPAELPHVREPLTASTGAPSWVWAALLMAGFVGLTAVTMALVRLPLVQKPPPLIDPDEAPDEQARLTLDAISGSGLLDRGELREYYKRIASCLREYLGHRFDSAASTMTPQELERRLEALEVGRRPARIAVGLLQQCEAVQSAQHEPTRERAEADLSAAYELVTLTSASGGEQGLGC